MITVNGDEVRIDIDAEEFFESMALLEGLQGFCEKKTEAGVSKTAKALAVAIEAMIAFACEHFQEELSE